MTAEDKKYSDYMLVFGSGSQIEKRVVEAMQEGWKPLGGIALTTYNDGEGDKTYFYQAMVKE